LKRLLLIGGGHSHLFVLKKFASLELTGVEVTMVSPGRWQYYSGMIPGWMAGHYQRDDIRVDLQHLTDSAGVRFIRNWADGIDADNRSVLLSDGSLLEYDVLSLDIGSETRRDWLEDCGTRLLTIKPLQDFQTRWNSVVEDARRRDGYKLVVVGGGAAGVELALSAISAFKRVSATATVHLVTGLAGFLQGHSEKARRSASRALRNAGVCVLKDRAAGTADGVLLSSGVCLGADTVLAATGACAPAFLRSTGLSLDADGFIEVDPFQRSISHANVFAAGDISSRDNPDYGRSGVHAVRVGPTLAHNLLQALAGRPLKKYRPQKVVLYLLACGGKFAIASWGRFSISGGWVWRWKDHIDRRFVARFSR
jgi:pyridine nucleotide-disulfide oxidoreductase family protein